MAKQFQIESLGDHDYIVRAQHKTGVTESRVQADPSVIDRLDLPMEKEQRVVEETAAFLAERQPVVDLPQLIDLEDVAAAYDDYLDELSRRLRTP